MTGRTWLIAALDKAADVIIFDPPRRWPQWIIYLLEALQDKTSVECYEEFLRHVKDAITIRLEDGRWQLMDSDS